MGWVQGAGAIAGAASSILGNNAAKSAAKTNNANAAVVSGAQNQMLNQAEQVSSQPFEAYTGTLTAPMSGNEQQGYSLASQTANNGQAQADNTKATGLVDQVAGSDWNTATANKYMNPYTSAVTDNAIAAANKSNLQAQSALAERAGQNSSFGGSRNAIENATLANDNNVNIGALTAKGNADAYNSAMNAWQSDNAMKLNASKAYDAAGQDLTQMNSQQISDLMKTGGVSQAISQTDLSNQYNQFMRQQNWSADQLKSLMSAVGTAKGSTTQKPAVQSNTANQLLGLGSTLAGLWGGGSGSPSVSNGETQVLNQNDNTNNDFGFDTNSAYGAGQNLNIPAPTPATT